MLAFVIAIEENHVLAAAEAQKEKMKGGSMAFAKMIHTERGKNLVSTLKLGETIKIFPTDTAAVDAIRVQGAETLAGLVRLDGKDFERGYLTAMVKGNEEALAMFDNHLSKAVTNEALQKHLTETRQRIASHLEKARLLMSELGGAATGGI